MIRKIMERVSRGVILKRRLPASHGALALLVSPDASLRFWRFNLAKSDPTLLNAAKALVGAGDVVWDVGANVGLFSFASAGISGSKVLAIEPDPWLANLLRRSARLPENKAAHIDVLAAAVGDRVGTAVLNIAERGRAANFVSGFSPSSQAGGVRERVILISVTLDWLLGFWPPPAVLKIDVEGAELSVLRGAQRLLREVRPRILCEISAENCDQATDILRAAGYAIYDADQQPAMSVVLARCAWNTIAVPVKNWPMPQP